MGQYQLNWPGIKTLNSFIIDTRNGNIYGKDNPVPPNQQDINHLQNTFVDIEEILGMFPDNQLKDVLTKFTLLVNNFSLQHWVHNHAESGGQYIHINLLLNFLIVYPYCAEFQRARAGILRYMTDFLELICKDCGFVNRDCRCKDKFKPRRSCHKSLSKEIVGSLVNLHDEGTQTMMEYSVCQNPDTLKNSSSPMMFMPGLNIPPYDISPRTFPRPGFNQACPPDIYFNDPFIGHHGGMIPNGHPNGHPFISSNDYINNIPGMPPPFSQSGVPMSMAPPSFIPPPSSQSNHYSASGLLSAFGSHVQPGRPVNQPVPAHPPGIPTHSSPATNITIDDQLNKKQPSSKTHNVVKQKKSKDNKKENVKSHISSTKVTPIQVKFPSFKKKKKSSAESENAKEEEPTKPAKKRSRKAKTIEDENFQLVQPGLDFKAVVDMTKDNALMAKPSLTPVSITKIKKEPLSDSEHPEQLASVEKAPNVDGDSASLGSSKESLDKTTDKINKLQSAADTNADSDTDTIPAEAEDVETLEAIIQSLKDKDECPSEPNSTLEVRLKDNKDPLPSKSQEKSIGEVSGDTLKKVSSDPLPGTSKDYVEPLGILKESDDVTNISQQTQVNDESSKQVIQSSQRTIENCNSIDMEDMEEAVDKKDLDNSHDKVPSVQKPDLLLLKSQCYLSSLFGKVVSSSEKDDVSSHKDTPDTALASQKKDPIVSPIVISPSKPDTASKSGKADVIDLPESTPLIIDLNKDSNSSMANSNKSIHEKDSGEKPVLGDNADVAPDGHIAKKADDKVTAGTKSSPGSQPSSPVMSVKDETTMPPPSLVGINFRKGYAEFKFIPTGENMLRCVRPGCGQCFDTEDMAKVHRDCHYTFSHTGLRCFLCSDFKVKSVRWYDMIRHIMDKHKDHEKIPNVLKEEKRCSFCALEFDSQDDLEDHQLWHQLSQYKCVHCGETLHTWTHVKKHREECAEKDKGQFYYNCPYCHIVFHGPGLQEVHVKSHRDEGLACIYCVESTQVYMWKQLKPHYEQFHLQKGQKRMHRCLKCRMHFSSIVKFRQHMEKRHSKEKQGEKKPLKDKQNKADNDNQEEKNKQEDKSSSIKTTSKMADSEQKRVKRKRKRKEIFRDDDFLVDYEGLENDFKGDDDEEDEDENEAKQPKTEEVKQFECPDCGKKFKAEKRLKWHVERSHGKEVQCPECDYVAINDYHLKAHKNYKHGQKQNVCTDCGKSFNKYFQLKIHMATHARKSFYICRVCKEEFHSHSDLRKHRLESHTSVSTNDEPTIACDKCDFKTFTHSSLLGHQRRMHPKEKPEPPKRNISSLNRKLKKLIPKAGPVIGKRGRPKGKFGKVRAAWGSKTGRMKAIMVQESIPIESVDDQMSITGKRGKVTKEALKLFGRKTCARTRTITENRIMIQKSKADLENNVTVCEDETDHIGLMLPFRSNREKKGYDVFQEDPMKKGKRKSSEENSTHQPTSRFAKDHPAWCVDVDHNYGKIILSSRSHRRSSHHGSMSGVEEFPDKSSVVSGAVVRRLNARNVKVVTRPAASHTQPSAPLPPMIPSKISPIKLPTSMAELAETPLLAQDDAHNTSHDSLGDLGEEGLFGQDPDMTDILKAAAAVLQDQNMMEDGDNSFDISASQLALPRVMPPSVSTPNSVMQDTDDGKKAKVLVEYNAQDTFSRSSSPDLSSLGENSMAKEILNDIISHVNSQGSQMSIHPSQSDKGNDGSITPSTSVTASLGDEPSHLMEDDSLVSTQLHDDLSNSVSENILPLEGLIGIKKVTSQTLPRQDILGNLSHNREIYSGDVEPVMSMSPKKTVLSTAGLVGVSPVSEHFQRVVIKKSPVKQNQSPGNKAIVYRRVQHVPPTAVTKPTEKTYIKSITPVKPSHSSNILQLRKTTNEYSPDYDPIPVSAGSTTFNLPQTYNHMDTTAEQESSEIQSHNQGCNQSMGLENSLSQQQHNIGPLEDMLQEDVHAILHQAEGVQLPNHEGEVEKGKEHKPTTNSTSAEPTGLELLASVAQTEPPGGETGDINERYIEEH